MTNQQILNIVQSIFIQHFNIKPEQFDIEKPLEVLHEDFKILSNLVVLEQILNKKFKIHIHLLKHISPVFHTPKDIINLIQKKL